MRTPKMRQRKRMLRIRVMQQHPRRQIKTKRKNCLLKSKSEISRSKSSLPMLSWRRSGRRSGNFLPQRWVMVNLSSLRILRARSRRSWRRARTCSGTCIRKIGSLVLAATQSANPQARIASFMALPTWTMQVVPLVIMQTILRRRRTTLAGVRVCRSKLL